MGGIHGDEYEAQIVLSRFIREFEPHHIRGRLIIIPAMNLPAALAGTRVSPIDDLNLNRCFPGDPDGRPTEQIAYYVDSELLPMCNIWFDWHSGGSSLDYVPFASIHRFKSAEHNSRNIAALEAFGAPVSVVWSFFDEVRMAKSCAERHGLTYLGSEFGGAGRVNPDAVKLCRDGTLRALSHLGMLLPDAPFDYDPPAQTRYVEIAGRDFSFYAPATGLFEPVLKLEAEVDVGQLVGYVHFIDDPAREPVPVMARAAGVLLMLRHQGITQQGDCVAQISREIPKPQP
jgi:predicted deacylase